MTDIKRLQLRVRAASFAVQAELVYEADDFTLNGVDQQPTHKRRPFAKERGGNPLRVALPTEWASYRA